MSAGAVATERVSVRDALHAALADEMAADPSVLLMGEDIAVAGGVFQVTRGLQERFGPARVIDTPISEMALAGAGFGAAVTGLATRRRRSCSPTSCCWRWTALVNQAAKYAFVSGGAGQRAAGRSAARWGAARGWGRCIPRSRRRGSWACPA